MTMKICLSFSSHYLVNSNFDPVKWFYFSFVNLTGAVHFLKFGTFFPTKKLPHYFLNATAPFASCKENYSPANQGE